MDIKELTNRGQYVLDKVLAFIPRVDSKGSALLAINTAMLAILGGNTPAMKSFDEWYMFLPVLPLLSISVSLWYLYQCTFPSLDGGHSSLIYFREIAKRTENISLMNSKLPPKKLT